MKRLVFVQLLLSLVFFGCGKERDFSCCEHSKPHCHCEHHDKHDCDCDHCEHHDKSCSEDEASHDGLNQFATDFEQPIFTGNVISVLDTKSFESLLDSSDGKVVAVVFGTVWCHYCKQLKLNVIDPLSQEDSTSVQFVDVDGDRVRQLGPGNGYQTLSASRYPTTFLLKKVNGRWLVKSSFVGAVSKTFFKTQLLKAHNAQ